MEEIEKPFRCPYCHQRITMMLDLSVGGTQSYIEDCEVCCQPIQITFTSANGNLAGFDVQRAG